MAEKESRIIVDGQKMHIQSTSSANYRQYLASGSVHMMAVGLLVVFLIAYFTFFTPASTQASYRNFMNSFLVTVPLLFIYMLVHIIMEHKNFYVIIDRDAHAIIIETPKKKAGEIDRQSILIDTLSEFLVQTNKKAWFYRITKLFAITTTSRKKILIYWHYGKILKPSTSDPDAFRVKEKLEAFLRGE